MGPAVTRTCRPARGPRDPQGLVPAMIDVEIQLLDIRNVYVPQDDPLLNEIALVAAAVEHFRRAEARSAKGSEGEGGAVPRSLWKWHGRGGG